MNKKEAKALELKNKALIREAFFEAIKDIKANIDYKAFEAAFARADIPSAMAALNIDKTAFQPYQVALDNSFISAGTVVANEVTKAADTAGVTDIFGTKAVMRFDVRDTNAEDIMRQFSSTKVKAVTDDQITSIRSALTEGLSRGDGPRAMSRELVGTYNRATKTYEGGIIGLTDKQRASVDKAKAQLAGDAADLALYKDRALRSKAFDQYIDKAIADGTPLSADIQRKAAQALENNTLVNRAETIARTEALQTLHLGQQAAYQQAIDKGLVAANEIQRTWDSSGDGRTRDSHEALNGQTVGWGEKYVTIDGVELAFPGDPNAPAAEIINCRCNETIKINYLARIGR